MTACADAALAKAGKNLDVRSWLKPVQAIEIASPCVGASDARAAEHNEGLMAVPGVTNSS